MDASHLLDIARSYLGEREGSHRLTFATARAPWCAAFASAVLIAAGATAPTGESCPMLWSARALVEWWRSRGCALPLASQVYQPGDLVLFERRHDGRLVGYHVAFVVEQRGPELVVVNGNSGPHADAVVISERRADEVVMAARVCS